MQGRWAEERHGSLLLDNVLEDGYTRATPLAVDVDMTPLTVRVRNWEEGYGDVRGADMTTRERSGGEDRLSCATWSTRHVGTDRGRPPISRQTSGPPPPGKP